VSKKSYTAAAWAHPEEVYGLNSLVYHCAAADFESASAMSCSSYPFLFFGAACESEIRR